MNRFKWFSEALQAAHDAGPAAAFESDLVARAITGGQRFYIPGGPSLVEGKPYADIKSLLRLPFPVCAIATEEYYGDSGDWDRSVICCEETERGYEAVSLRYTSDLGRWAISPRFMLSWNEDEATATRGVFDTPLARAYQRTMASGVAAWMRSTLHVAGNFMLLMNLSNTKAELRTPEPGVMKARARNGKLPLYDYHVLSVGGEVWDSRGMDDGDGLGYRSHLRRGHIRRLSDERCVWVRATYVHGRQAGFVDKDYDTSKKAAQLQ